MLYEVITVDAVQLMPVFDSHGTYWGYDPVSWFELNPKYVITSYSIHYTKLYDENIPGQSDI